MIISEIAFVGSFEHESQCPTSHLPEYAFIGRSNVGKSSLINALTGRKALARISSTPGKTQLLNFFEINQEWYLVDLPGYGYAKISKSKRKKWRSMIERYLLLRQDLCCVFQLIDARHPLQSNDLEFMNWMGEHKIPFVIAFTKVDKLKKSEVHGKVRGILQSLSEHWDPLPHHFITSAEKRIGTEEILDFIEETNLKMKANDH
mgnify:CR=1 FL=1|jgi:GTP-binding protein